MNCAVPIRRGLILTACVGLIATGLLSLTSPAGAAPGSPGAPQPGTPLFAEGFETAQASLPVSVTAYVSANAGPGSALGTTYTASPGWLPPGVGGSTVSRCNGWVLSQDASLGSPAGDSW